MRLGASRAGRDPSDSTYHWWESTRGEQDHLEVPPSRRWHVAGTVIGAVVVLVLVTFVFAETDDQPIEYRDVLPTAIVTDADRRPTITSVDVQVDPAEPSEGRVRVSGDGLVRVEVEGGALCAAVVGAADAWIGVRFCGELDLLSITAADADGETTEAVAQF